MKRFIILSTLLTLAFADNASASKTGLEHKQDISLVIEKFRVSILNKDKETFSSLFYSDDIPWIAVFSDEMLEAKRKEKPDYPRSVNFGKFGPPVRMISEDGAQEEIIKNIKIETDGYLGSVHFDYIDVRDGIKKAHGTEAWDLVNDQSGWKIVSVKYTVTEIP